MKQTFHEYAGKTPQIARRSLAFKWIRIIHRCWKDRVPCDKDLYISRLKETQSPLYMLIRNAENLVQSS